MLIRLHKYLADHGVASRRKCEEYIRQGLIKVNGKTATKMGIKIDPEKDIVETDPKLEIQKQKFVYYALNKPVGYVCTVSGKEEPKITELIKDIPERIFPVGRLDKLTSGLLILTNDGRFAYEMTHPKFEKEKEYIAKVREKLDQNIIRRLGEGVFIYGKKARPAKISMQSPHLMKIILKQGRNRQIRRMCEACGLHIEKLKRIRIASLKLGDLESSFYRKLNPDEIKNLRV